MLLFSPTRKYCAGSRSTVPSECSTCMVWIRSAQSWESNTTTRPLAHVPLNPEHALFWHDTEDLCRTQCDSVCFSDAKCAWSNNRDGSHRQANTNATSVSTDSRLRLTLQRLLVHFFFRPPLFAVFSALAFIGFWALTLGGCFLYCFFCAAEAESDRAAAETGSFPGAATAGKGVRVSAADEADEADEEALRVRRDDTAGCSANMLKSSTTSLNLLMPAHSSSCSGALPATPLGALGSDSSFQSCGWKRVSACTASSGVLPRRCKTARSFGEGTARSACRSCCCRTPRGSCGRASNSCRESGCTGTTGFALIVAGGGALLACFPLTP